MMRCATQPIAQGIDATMTRSVNPHVRTDGPDSHRIWSTGGTLRRARIRSPHALCVPVLSFPLMESITCQLVSVAGRGVAAQPCQGKRLDAHVLQVSCSPTTGESI